jgi:hypothetical protein
MKLELTKISPMQGKHIVKILTEHESMIMVTFEYLSLDQIEDLELNLTNIIKQLYDYRQKHNV